MKIHADDCARLDHCCGNDCRCLRQKCDCHAQQALDELVAAASETCLFLEVNQAAEEARLQAALKPFLPNA